MDLVAVAEIAKMLGVSPQRVHQLSVKEGFPEPVAKLTVGRIWLRTTIETWATSDGRTVQGVSSQ